MIVLYNQIIPSLAPYFQTSNIQHLKSQNRRLPYFENKAIGTFKPFSIMTTTSEILLQLIIGGLLGVVGQMLRFIVGLKKLNEEAKDKNIPTAEMFQTSRFIISLIIGFIAGVLGIVSLSNFTADFFSKNLKETIITLLGIGYAGTDFIEGFIKKYIPDPSQELVSHNPQVPKGGQSQPS